MQRGLGDSVGGANEGQEDGRQGFSVIVQDGDDLISWDGDLSVGDPSDGIPQVTESEDNLPGPSHAEFDQVMRERDQALQQFGEMLRALQLASQAMSEHKMDESSRGSHSVEDFCKGRVRTSCAPETGSGEARSSSQAHVTINEFGPCGPRVSYSQPNISPGVEFRENCRVGKAPTGRGFNELFPMYHNGDDFVNM